MPERPMRSRFGRAIKWLVILSGMFVIGLLVSVLLLLTYFFPSELVRKELEVRASDLLEGEIRITSLSFNLFTGLELEHVAFSKQEQPLLNLKRLNLDYNLFGLIGGKLKINEVLVDQAEIALNIPELVALEPRKEVPAAPQPVPPPEEPTLPALPISIDLEALAVKQSNFDVVVSPTLAVNLTNVNLDLSGGVTQEAAELDGSLTVDDIAVALENQHIRLPLDVAFSLATNLSDQHLTLHQLTVKSEPAIRFTLSGIIEEFLTNKTMDLSLRDVELDLKKLLSMAKDFVPPDLRSIAVKGNVSPTLRLKGSLPESEFQGKIDLAVEVSGLEADLPPFSSKLQRTDVSMQVSDLTIRENSPQFGNLKVNVSNKGMQYKDYSIRNVRIELTNEFFDAGPIAGSLRVSAVPTIPPVGPLESLTLPIQLQLEANGNFKSQDLILRVLGLKLGDLVTAKVRGEIHPQKPPTQGFNVSFTSRMSPHINTLLPLVPPEMLKGISLDKGIGSDLVVINVTGAFNPEYRPTWGKLTARVRLTDITSSIEALPAGGTLDQANVLVSANYSGETGQISSTLGTALQLSNLYQGGSLAVGQTELKLKSSLFGTLASDFSLTSLRSQDMMTIRIADIVYDDPSLKAGIDQVAVSLKTKEDILGQNYEIERFQVSSDPLLELNAKGRYRMADQEFSINADIPYINVGGLLSHLSGELVQGISEMNPQGRIGLSVNALGRVPQPADIDSLNVPVEAAATISLQNVEGAFAQHQVKGAAGGLSMTFTPGDHPVAKIATDVKVNAIQLAPGLPVDRLTDAMLQFHASAKDFEEVEVSRLRVGATGAELDVKGKVTGVRGFLNRDEELGKTLSKLFAQMNTQAFVDLEQFHDVLKSAGLAGSGQAKVNISMLKKEEGPFDGRLAVTFQKVNLSREGTTVRNVNGSLSFRKHLLWNPDSAAASLSPSFSPTDMLSQLLSLTPKRKNLTIEHLDLGWLIVSNFATHIVFERNAFKIQNLAMNLLDGGLGGNVVLTSGRDFGFSARLEAAQLDLNELLDKELRITGDSRVDSTIGLAVFFDEKTGALDLTRTALDLYITHIGKEALDRLLVFLDPQGSNPTLVSARSQVKLALPSRVTIRMVRGMMSLEILFAQGFVPDFRIDRIPAGKTKILKKITQAIPLWKTIAQSVTLIGAETYGIDEDGNILLR